MTAAGGPRRRAPRPLRRIGKVVGRWKQRVAISLGLRPAPADCGYMILATPRSGSNYLCELLASTGKLGNPLEFLNMAGGERYADPDRPPKPRRQLGVIRTRGATGNGIYAVKLLPANYLFARRKVDLFSDLPNLKVVRLRRRDLLGQAISLSRVRQTGQFMSSYPSTAEATYSERGIRSCLKALLGQEAMWDDVLSEAGVQPLALDYEDVMRDPQRAVDQVAALMGVAPPVPIDPAVVMVTIQRDRSSDEWRRRFLADTGEEFRHLAI
jgi:LPS sulfotransferase NodH